MGTLYDYSYRLWRGSCNYGNRWTGRDVYIYGSKNDCRLDQIIKMGLIMYLLRRYLDDQIVLFDLTLNQANDILKILGDDRYCVEEQIDISS